MMGLVALQHIAEQLERYPEVDSVMIWDADGLSFDITPDELREAIAEKRRLAESRGAIPGRFYRLNPSDTLSPTKKPPPKRGPGRRRVLN